MGFTRKLLVVALCFSGMSLGHGQDVQDVQDVMKECSVEHLNDVLQVRTASKDIYNQHLKRIGANDNEAKEWDLLENDELRVFRVFPYLTETCQTYFDFDFIEKRAVHNGDYTWYFLSEFENVPPATWILTDK